MNGRCVTCRLKSKKWKLNKILVGAIKKTKKGLENLYIKGRYILL